VTQTAVSPNEAEVSRIGRVPPSALRFYERMGLLQPAGRNGLRRTYRPDALDRVALILNARATGFSPAELRDLPEADPDGIQQRLRDSERYRRARAGVGPPCHGRQPGPGLCGSSPAKSWCRASR